MDNMSIYEAARACPQDALKPITAGKLKGKSDVNPMWRIKRLTELFGPCGIGWRTTDECFWFTPGAGGEVVAWCSIRLQYADPESHEWSSPVFGIGGSMLVDTQRGQLASNDDAYKMAYTDAISVACKALGFAADVYWGADRTKYEVSQAHNAPVCEHCGKPIQPTRCGERVYGVDEIIKNSKSAYNAQLCWACMRGLKKNGKAEAKNENAG